MEPVLRKIEREGRYQDEVRDRLEGVVEHPVEALLRSGSD